MSEIDKIYLKNPLSRFSMYSQFQAEYLIEIADDISIKIDDLLMIENTIDGANFKKTYGYITLWIFGSYELIRTLCQPKDDTFSDEFKVKILELKKDLSVVRVPLAKQERKGKNVPASEQTYIKEFDFKNKDISFNIDNSKSIKTLIGEFKTLIESIKSDDVSRGIWEQFIK